MATLPKHTAPLPEGDETFRDGLGVRCVVTDPISDDRLERFYLVAELARQGLAVDERTSRLANFRHARFSRLRGVGADPDPESMLVWVNADPVDGLRLFDVLRAAEQGRVVIDVNSALQVAREILPALATLHGSRNVTHGALGPERLVLTPQARLTIVDHGLGSALGKLQYPRTRLWREFRIAVPPSAGVPQFDARADVAMVAMTVLAALLGRPITLNEFPDHLRELLDQARERPVNGRERSLSAGLRGWLERTLPLESRRPLATALEAQVALEEAIKKERSYAPGASALKHLVERLGPLMKATISPAPTPPKVVVQAPQDESPEASRPAAPRSAKRAAKRRTVEEEEADEIAFLEQELARLAAEEAAGATPHAAPVEVAAPDSVPSAGVAQATAGSEPPGAEPQGTGEPVAPTAADTGPASEDTDADAGAIALARLLDDLADAPDASAVAETDGFPAMPLATGAAAPPQDVDFEGPATTEIISEVPLRIGDAPVVEFSEFGAIDASATDAAGPAGMDFEGVHPDPRTLELDEDARAALELVALEALDVPPPAAEGVAPDTQDVVEGDAGTAPAGEVWCLVPPSPSSDPVPAQGDPCEGTTDDSRQAWLDDRETLWLDFGVMHASRLMPAASVVPAEAAVPARRQRARSRLASVTASTRRTPLARAVRPLAPLAEPAPPAGRPKARPRGRRPKPAQLPGTVAAPAAKLAEAPRPGRLAGVVAAAHPPLRLVPAFAKGVVTAARRSVAAQLPADNAHGATALAPVAAAQARPCSASLRLVPPVADLAALLEQLHGTLAPALVARTSAMDTALVVRPSARETALALVPPPSWTQAGPVIPFEVAWAPEDAVADIVDEVAAGAEEQACGPCLAAPPALALVPVAGQPAGELDAAALEGVGGACEADVALGEVVATAADTVESTEAALRALAPVAESSTALDVEAPESEPAAETPVVEALDVPAVFEVGAPDLEPVAELPVVEDVDVPAVLEVGAPDLEPVAETPVAENVDVPAVLEVEAPELEPVAELPVAEDVDVPALLEVGAPESELAAELPVVEALDVPAVFEVEAAAAEPQVQGPVQAALESVAADGSAEACAATTEPIAVEPAPEDGAADAVEARVAVEIEAVEAPPAEAAEEAFEAPDPLQGDRVAELAAPAVEAAPKFVPGEGLVLEVDGIDVSGLRVVPVAPPPEPPGAEPRSIDDADDELAMLQALLDAGELLPEPEPAQVDLAQPEPVATPVEVGLEPVDSEALPEAGVEPTPDLADHALVEPENMAPADGERLLSSPPDADALGEFAVDAPPETAATAPAGEAVAEARGTAQPESLDADAELAALIEALREVEDEEAAAAAAAAVRETLAAEVGPVDAPAACAPAAEHAEAPSGESARAETPALAGPSEAGAGDATTTGDQPSEGDSRPLPVDTGADAAQVDRHLAPEPPAEPSPTPPAEPAKRRRSKPRGRRRGSPRPAAVTAPAATALPVTTPVAGPSPVPPPAPASAPPAAAASPAPAPVTPAEPVSSELAQRKALTSARESWTVVAMTPEPEGPLAASPRRVPEVAAVHDHGPLAASPSFEASLPNFAPWLAGDPLPAGAAEASPRAVAPAIPTETDPSSVYSPEPMGPVAAAAGPAPTIRVQGAPGIDAPLASRLATPPAATREPGALPEASWGRSVPSAQGPTLDFAPLLPGPAAEPADRSKWLVVAALMALLVAGAAAAFWALRPEGAGTLVVQTSANGVEVFIDGHSRGVTPVSVELPAGRHAVELRGHGTTRALEVEVKAGARTTQQVNWSEGQSKGSLKVTSTPPGAKVLIGGELRGVTPVVVEGLTAGSHVVTVQGDSGTVRRTAAVRAGEVAEIDVSIFSGWLQVFAPFRVDVRVEGRRVGTSEDGKLLLPSGSHLVELADSTFGVAQRHRVEITPGGTTTLSMDAPLGTIEVDAPAGTQVYVDKELVGTTPLGTPLRVKVGTREVVLSHAASKRMQRVVVKVTTGGAARVGL